MSSTGEENRPSAGDANDGELPADFQQLRLHSDGDGQDTTDMGNKFARALPVKKQETEQSPQRGLDIKDVALNYGLPVYNMTHTKRGYCLIFNQMEFYDTTLERRKGSEKDAASLKAAFGKLGFDVQTFKDSNSAQLLQVLDKYSKNTDHSNCDCFALVLLSHGKEGEFHVYDKKLPIDTLTEPFKPDECKSLAGKPKLFFYQACRGEKYMGSFEVADGPSDEVDKAPKAQVERFPLEADFCYFYSTPPGYYSWRNKLNGSWFGQELAAVLTTCGNCLEFQHIMLLVQSNVATGYESKTDKSSTDGKKQMPVVVSKLRKLLYFHDKQYGRYEERELKD